MKFRYLKVLPILVRVPNDMNGLVSVSMVSEKIPHGIFTGCLFNCIAQPYHVVNTQPNFAQSCFKFSLRNAKWIRSAPTPRDLEKLIIYVDCVWWLGGFLNNQERGKVGGMGEHMGEREVVDGMGVVEVVEEGWEEGGGEHSSALTHHSL